jgi:hypothetical protein
MVLLRRYVLGNLDIFCVPAQEPSYSRDEQFPMLCCDFKTESNVTSFAHVNPSMQHFEVEEFLKKRYTF